MPARICTRESRVVCLQRHSCLWNRRANECGSTPSQFVAVEARGPPVPAQRPLTNPQALYDAVCGIPTLLREALQIQFESQCVHLASESSFPQLPLHEGGQHELARKSAQLICRLVVALVSVVRVVRHKEACRVLLYSLHEGPAARVRPLGLAQRLKVLRHRPSANCSGALRRVRRVQTSMSCRRTSSTCGHACSAAAMPGRRRLSRTRAHLGYELLRCAYILPTTLPTPATVCTSRARLNCTRAGRARHVSCSKSA